MNEQKGAKVEATLAGEAIGRGAVKELGNCLFWFVVVMICLNFARRQFGWDMDDSDKSGTERSGVAVKTDYKTGVQYLSDGKGGLHVRISADGKPMVDPAIHR